MAKWSKPGTELAIARYSKFNEHNANLCLEVLAATTFIVMVYILAEAMRTESGNSGEYE